MMCFSLIENRVIIIAHVNGPSAYSKEKFEWNDKLPPFVESSNAHNSDRGSYAIQ